jgi:tetratricopeptide (TPR) repeat protein
MTTEDIELRIKEINQMRVSGDARNGLPLALELEDHLLLSELPTRDSYLARTKGVIAIFYTQLGDLGKALQYNEESLQFREKIGDVKNIAGNLHNLGSIYLILGDHKRAVEYFERALTLNREHHNVLWTANNLLSLGNVRLLERDANGALGYLLDGLSSGSISKYWFSVPIAG